MLQVQRFGFYEVAERLGDGGTGVVLRCVHQASGERAVIKIPKLGSPLTNASLRREIGVLSRLGRRGLRGVVRLLEHGVTADVPWYAMELLEGHSLRQWCHGLWNNAHGDALPDVHVAPTETIAVEQKGIRDAGRREPDQRSTPSPIQVVSTEAPLAAAGQLGRALRVMLRVAEVLAQLHGEGVIHGDVSPSNIVFRDELDPVLIDFGAALVAFSADGSQELPAQGAGLCGTTAYLAPELIAGEPIDARCDLYAFGCMLYEVVCGTRAFDATNVSDLLRQHACHVPPSPERHVRGVPDGLARLVMQLLEKDPARRISRALDVCDGLRELIGVSAPTGPALAQPSAPLYRPHLHGRAAVLDQLRSSLQHLLATGQGDFTIVAAESGMGKTRLLKELGRTASESGATVIWCRGIRAVSEHDQALALPATSLSIFADWIETQVQAAAGRVEALRDLARVLPQLQALLPPSDDLPQQPELAKQRAFSALAKLLRDAAGEVRPALVLLLDDLQWADEFSSAFLVQHARELAQGGVLLVGNHRSEEPSAATDALAACANRTLTLSGLDQAATRAMLRDMLACSELPVGLSELVFEQARGNPFFVAEYTRAALSSGLLQRLPFSEWHFDRAREPLLETPRAIDALLGLRVAALSERARAALAVASVLQGDFPASAFAVVTGSELDTPEVLEELVARDVFVSTGADRYRFAHDKLREAQLRVLSPTSRQALHALVAAHLELSAAEQPEHYAALGYHWACAAEPARALLYLEPAALTAQATHSLDRAAQLCRLGLSQCELAKPRDPLQPSRLREMLADVLQQQAKHAEAQRCFEQLERELPETAALARARLLRKSAASFWTIHDYAAAAGALDRASQALEAVPERYSVAYCLELVEHRLGRFEQLYFSGKVGAELDALMHELTPLIKRWGSADQTCMFYFMAASYVMLQSRYAYSVEAMRLAAQGVEAARRVPHREAVAHFIHGYALMLGTSEQCRLAATCFERALPRALQDQDATLISRIRTYYAITLLRLGRVDETEVAADEAEDAARRAQLTPYIASAEWCRGWVAWRRGQHIKAFALLQQARARWRAHPHRFPFENLAAFPLLELKLGDGDVAELTALLTEMPDRLPALPEELDAAVRGAALALQQGLDRGAVQAITHVLRCARKAAFV